MFEEDQDVITEVYDSWYEAFKIIRKQLEEIPEERIGDAKELIDIVLKVLNDGLRPHLTKWQAKYRAWYKKEKAKKSKYDTSRYDTSRDSENVSRVSRTCIRS